MSTENPTCLPTLGSTKAKGIEPILPNDIRIEVMIVVVIIALLMGGVGLSIGATYYYKVFTYNARQVATPSNERMTTTVPLTSWPRVRGSSARVFTPP